MRKWIMGAAAAAALLSPLAASQASAQPYGYGDGYVRHEHRDWRWHHRDYWRDRREAWRREEWRRHHYWRHHRHWHDHNRYGYRDW
jgi:hypothetical protein